MTLVVFDLGGVLVRIRHTWDAILEALGEPPLARTSAWHHADYDPILRYQNGTMDEDAYLEQVGGDLGLTPERARAAHAAMLEGDYVGAVGLIEDLKAAGVKTACLSNTNALHWVALMACHPTMTALDARFASFEMNLSKPDPRAYRVVADAFPGVDRKIFFDDRLDNVVAAINLGWEAHRVDPDGNPPALMRAILTEGGVLPPSP